MGVSAAVTMDTGMLIFCTCADAHIYCCLSIKWLDQGVVYLFDYPACLWNQGVRGMWGIGYVVCGVIGYVVWGMWCGVCGMCSQGYVVCGVWVCGVLGM